MCKGTFNIQRKDNFGLNFDRFNLLLWENEGKLAELSMWCGSRSLGTFWQDINRTVYSDVYVCKCGIKAFSEDQFFAIQTLNKYSLYRFDDIFSYMKINFGHLDDV